MGENELAVSGTMPLGALRLGIGRLMLPIPAFLWRSEVTRNARRMKRRFEALTGLEREVRAFVVREMPRLAAPIPPELISNELGAPREEVQTSLEALERGMTWLVRDPEGAVAWAYPLTVTHTPHHLAFDTGERLDAA